MKSYFTILASLALALSVASCDDMLSGLYDEPIEDTSADSPFSVSTTDGITVGTLTVDATNYTKWVYIDFHSLSTDTATIPSSAVETAAISEPTAWDIAVHRYDAKTNNGAAIKTSYTSIDDFLDNPSIPTTGYVADSLTSSTVMIDVSKMVLSIIGYGYTNYNKELSSWLYVDTSTMPPGYNLYDNVYLVRLSDDSMLAIHLDSYMNSASIKGHLTFSFAYPVN